LGEVGMTISKALLIILTICIVFGLAAAAYSFM
jgi:capsular polysaccharide biosynthesis protein